MPSPFLTAQWRKLILVNYAVEARHLEKHVPFGTQLDTFKDICYVSLVGFMFNDIKVKGVAIPFHQNFPEVNLRFYVKHQTKNGAWRRGVVFIREFVPKVMVSLVANTVYGEHYETVEMDHTCKETDSLLEVQYSLEKGKNYSMSIIAEKCCEEIPVACEAEFITEHYWGYTKLSDHKTSAYEVWHPRWRAYPVKEFFSDIEFGVLYGEEFSFLNKLQPFSVMLAEGSEIKVYEGRSIESIVR